MPLVPKNSILFPFIAFSITSQIMKERDLKNIQVGDFIDRLREIVKNLPEKLNEKIITVQGIIFFVAGFETTAHTLSTLTYNLAMNPDIQEKALINHKITGAS